MSAKYQVFNGNDTKLCCWVLVRHARTLVDAGLLYWAEVCPKWGNRVLRTFRPMTRWELHSDAALKRLARPETSGSMKPIKGTGLRASPRNSGPSPELLHWREQVFQRDGYKCVFCGTTENLEADHIKPKSLYPDLKYDVSNGRALCNPCHRQTETYGRKVRKIVEVHVESA